MQDELTFRPLKEEDYKTICSWWKWWRWPVIPKEMLPDDGKSGFMVEKNNTPIVCGFLFITNSKGVKLEWIVSNPKYKETDRKDAIKLLINNIENTCKQMGYKYIFSIGRNKHLMETHRKLGWFVDEKPSYEIIKTL